MRKEKEEFSKNKNKPFVEVRMHGRGGQGMVTASFILASAFVEEGLHVQAFPEFGPERRGAPVKAYLRFSKEYIYRREPVINPDVVVVADESLLMLEDVFDGVGEDTIFVVNISPEKRDKKFGLIRDRGVRHIYFVDALSISLDVLKKTVVNTAMVGAFMKAFGSPSFQSVENVIGRFIKDVEKNMTALKLAYEKTEKADF